MKKAIFCVGKLLMHAGLFIAAFLIEGAAGDWLDGKWEETFDKK